MIKLESVFFNYGNVSVLSNISLEIKENERVVILGINGSGKSTLLKILNGLIYPQKGKYTFNGDEITKKYISNKTNNKNFRKKVVLLFQNPDMMIFNPTVYDEIAFGLKQLGFNDIENKVKYWADKLKISDHLDTPPFKLSGGEKQKVCLASILALEPKVLLLDEPTANLDPRTTGWFVDFFYDLNLTTLIATNNISLALELGERGLVLSEDHELIYDDDLEQLLDDKESLLKANLIHKHKHRHNGLEHKHYHIHYWS
ncbi:ATPase component NikO of energizing module of nickel ECF transporter [hydrothermal vent metagenome]|uniref:ATPase component NikO of energizing module of nickel ECF transporter n=1 Tax=hydrothermal vent metagenome TaxID=652676 RepID=A0A3B1C421_9ZZZZ